MVKLVFRVASRIDEAHPARPLGFIGVGSSPASPSSGGLGERLALGVGDGGDAPFAEPSAFVRLISPCRGRAGRHYFNPRQEMTFKRSQKQDMTFLIKLRCYYSLQYK